jgi:hypothetical protein
VVNFDHGGSIMQPRHKVEVRLDSQQREALDRMTMMRVRQQFAAEGNRCERGPPVCQAWNVDIITRVPYDNQMSVDAAFEGA